MGGGSRRQRLLAGFLAAGLLMVGQPGVAAAADAQPSAHAQESADRAPAQAAGAQNMVPALDRAARALRMSPGNDSFVDAVTISGETGSVTGSNFDATAEAGEPALGGDGQSVWWVWTAPKDGALMLYVDDDWVDQFVSVHQGGAVNSLAEAGRGEFRTSVAVYSGQSYRIAVDGTDGGSSFNLEWSMSIPPANDNFANAGSMSGANGQLIGTTAGASVESGEPDSSHFTRSVWWTVTAQQTGVLSVEPSSAFADVYTGPSVNALSPVANDRNHWNEYPVTVGQTYSIRVESQYELDIEIAWSLGDAPANDDFVNAATLAGTSGSVNGTTRKASAEVDEPGLWSPVGLHTTDPTVWYAWTAPEDGTLEVHLTGSGYFEGRGCVYGLNACNAGAALHQLRGLRWVYQAGCWRSDLLHRGGYRHRRRFRPHVAVRCNERMRSRRWAFV